MDEGYGDLSEGGYMTDSILAQLLFMSEHWVQGVFLQKRTIHSKTLPILKNRIDILLTKQDSGDLAKLAHEAYSELRRFERRKSQPRNFFTRSPYSRLWRKKHNEHLVLLMVEQMCMDGETGEDLDLNSISSKAIGRHHYKYNSYSIDPRDLLLLLWHNHKRIHHPQSYTLITPDAQIDMDRLSQAKNDFSNGRAPNHWIDPIRIQEYINRLAEFKKTGVSALERFFAGRQDLISLLYQLNAAGKFDHLK